MDLKSNLLKYFNNIISCKFDPSTFCMNLELVFRHADIETQNCYVKEFWSSLSRLLLSLYCHNSSSNRLKNINKPY